MGFLDKALVTGVLGLVLKEIGNSKRENDSEKSRAKIACEFTNELTEENFEDIVIQSAKSIKKKNISIEVYGANVYGTVVSQSGLTEWLFTIDYNDYGKITGEYWLWSENDDSLIPMHLADEISYKIRKILD